MRVGIMSFESYHGKKDIGSSRIRGEWLVNHWPEAELFTYGQKYDVIIFQKVYFVELARSFPGIKILDLCDPDWLAQQPVVEMAQECDAVTTSTQALADYIGKYTDKPCLHIKDRIDFNENSQKKTEHAEKIKSAVWYGYSHNAKALQSVLGSCRKRGIELTAISDRTVRDADTWVKYDRDTINDEIIKHDVVILPPPGGNVGKFKSENKTVNAWSLGMPVVCFGSYHEDFEKAYGELANLTFDNLETKEAREQEAQTRLALVKAEYDVKKSVAEYQQLISELKN